METMELTLNIIWLVLALAGFAWWAWMHRRAWTQGGVSGRRLGAVIFCSALLFPVISMTDDLHAQPAAYEDPAPARQVIQSGETGSGVTHSLRAWLMPATVTSERIPLTHDSWVASVASERVEPVSGLVAHSSPDRAPPLSR